MLRLAAAQQRIARSVESGGPLASSLSCAQLDWTVKSTLHARPLPELGMCCMQVPIYAHVKELMDPQTGRRTALEVNYCKFLAYNGSYKLFGWIYIGEVCRVPFALLLVKIQHWIFTTAGRCKHWCKQVGEFGKCEESHACVRGSFGCGCILLGSLHQEISVGRDMS